MSGIAVKSFRPEALTWDAALRLFLLRCKSKNLSESTQELYANHLGVLTSWLAANGCPLPADVQSSHLRAYLEARKARGNKDTTIDVVYRITRTFFTFLLRDGLIILDPMAKVERPRREKKFLKPVTEEQFKTLLAAIDQSDILGLRDYALILFLADTGLRISEALSIRVGEVEWAGCSVTVMGKGRKERRVAFGQAVSRMLRIWIQERGVAREDDFLWVNRFGRQMDRKNFQQRMKQHTRRAGIAADRLSPHALRHFFALTFLRNGGGEFALQKLLGHTSLTMVRNYANMSDDDAIARHRQASPLDRFGPLPGERKRVRLK